MNTRPLSRIPFLLATLPENGWNRTGGLVSKGDDTGSQHVHAVAQGCDLDPSDGPIGLRLPIHHLLIRHLLVYEILRFILAKGEPAWLSFAKVMTGEKKILFPYNLNARKFSALW